MKDQQKEPDKISKKNHERSAKRTMKDQQKEQ